MTDAGILFCHWLAGQSPFVQVTLGIAFLMIVVPLILAGVAVVVTKLEASFEQLWIDAPDLSRKFAGRLHTARWFRRQTREVPRNSRSWHAAAAAAKNTNGRSRVPSR